MIFCLHFVTLLIHVNYISRHMHVYSITQNLNKKYFYLKQNINWFFVIYKEYKKIKINFEFKYWLHWIHSIGQVTSGLEHAIHEPPEQSQFSTHPHSATQSNGQGAVVSALQVKATVSQTQWSSHSVAQSALMQSPSTSHVLGGVASDVDIVVAPDAVVVITETVGGINFVVSSLTVDVTVVVTTVVVGSVIVDPGIVLVAWVVVVGCQINHYLIIN